MNLATLNYGTRIHSKKPRLLMLTHRFPYPANRGDRIRSYNLLREMSRKFEVTLGALVDEPMTMAELEHVEAICDQVVVDRVSRPKRLWGAAKSVLRRKSITEGAFASSYLFKQIAKLHSKEPFDSVLVFCSSMFPYVDRPEFTNASVVVDLVDVDSRKWEQMSNQSGFFKNQIYGRESKRVRSLEQRIVNTASAVTLVSSAEADLFEQLVNIPETQTIQAISNGVDTDFFKPRLSSSCDKAEQGTVGSNESPLRLVFTGVMNYPPNVAGMEWFCRQVLPKLQSQINVELKIVGRFPNSRVESLGALSGVEVVGAVPDVRPFLAEADVAISPLKLARGIQNKVLEAMAMGTPVVCTSQSAEGIDGEDGVHMLIADDEIDWCSALSTLSRDKEFRNLLATSARSLVLNEYSWSAKTKPMFELLNPRF